MPGPGPSEGPFSAVKSVEDPRAGMIRALELQPGDTVLEIGTGSARETVRLADAVGDHGCVLTLDIDERRSRDAKAWLEREGKSNVRVSCGDGMTCGFTAQFDAAVLWTAVTDLPAAFASTLNPRARVVVPLQFRGDVQRVVRLRPRKDGRLVCDWQLNASLEPSSTPHSDSSRMELPNGYFLNADRDAVGTIDASGAAATLETIGGHLVPSWISDVDMTRSQYWDGLVPWVSIADASACTVGRMVGDREMLLLGGLATDTGLALLDLLTTAGGGSVEDEPMRLVIQAGGPSSGAVVERLRQLVAGWVAAGKPSPLDAVVVAHPAGSHLAPSPARWGRVSRRNWSFGIGPAPRDGGASRG